MNRAGPLLAGALALTGGAVVALGAIRRDVEFASGGAVLLFGAAVVLIAVVVVAETE